jgi:hypothetical protein
MIRHEGSQMTICTDEEVMKKVYQEAGKPGLICVREKIMWAPFRKRS